MNPEAEWGSVFVTTGGAAAALTGLLFVGVSLHPEEILSTPALRLRAAGALATFLALLILSVFALVPDRFHIVSGIGIALVAGAVLSWAMSRQIRVFRSGLSVPRAIVTDSTGVVILAAGVMRALEWQVDLAYLILTLAILVEFGAIGNQAWSLITDVGQLRRFVDGNVDTKVAAHRDA